MSGRFVSTLGVIAIMGGLLGVGAASASAQCLANEIAKLTASDAEFGDHLGTSVVIKDGLALVGATLGNGVQGNTGSAYVFRFDPAKSAWVEQQELWAEDGQGLDAFGISAAGVRRSKRCRHH